MEKRFEETWFYAPAENAGESLALPPEEAHHALRVLRLKPGAEMVVANGAGSVFLARLASEGGRIEILERLQHEPNPPGISLALGMLKGRDAELPVEGACEFPLTEVFLLLTDHSSEFKGQDFERLMERLRQKSLAALKQAKKTWLTRIHPPQDLRAWREAHRGVPLALAHPGEDALPSPLPSSMHVLIGPEGGFSKAELDSLLAQENCYRLSLGPTRLRAIHAPVAALGNLMGRHTGR
jgi:16S rRNA (uracil1498-N3)-methyltransferase